MLKEPDHNQSQRKAHRQSSLENSCKAEQKCSRKSRRIKHWMQESKTPIKSKRTGKEQQEKYRS